MRSSLIHIEDDLYMLLKMEAVKRDLSLKAFIELIIAEKALELESVEAEPEED